jgi:hypothetical protein
MYLIWGERERGGEGERERGKVTDNEEREGTVG